LEQTWGQCMQACGVPWANDVLECEHGHEENGVCVCQEGWAGVLCDDCAPDYTLDTWGECVGVCGADTCSGHGLCEVSNRLIRCTCDTGYQGARCEACASGYLDVQGLCRPTAGCVGVQDGEPCGVELRCLTAGVCDQGVCLGTDLDCDDGVACTRDGCDELAGGCTHEPAPTGLPEGFLDEPSCENGLDDDCDGQTDALDPDCLVEPCTSPGDCMDDGNPCTQAACPAGACAHEPAADLSACPGADACSSRYLCFLGECAPGPADLDADGDGAVDGACAYGTDCDDGDAAIHPGAEGLPGGPGCADGQDNDCDQVADGLDPDCWPAGCSPAGWCWQNARPAGHPLLGLHVGAADDAWAVGDEGAVVRWDGAAWREVEPPSLMPLSDVCGCGPDDVWVSQTHGEELWHWDGSSWTVTYGPMSATGFQALACVCTTSPCQDVWAVGRNGAAAHWDGLAWVEVATSTSADLEGLWAAGPTDLWAVGDDGTLLRSSGGEFSAWTSGTSEDLQGVWGRAADEVYAVGRNGVVLRFDGAAWTPEQSGTDRHLWDVWGTPGGPLYAVGDSVYGGVLLWSPVPGAWQQRTVLPETPGLYALGGTADTDVWAVGLGGAILTKSAGSWRSSSAITRRLTDVCALEHADGTIEGWAVGWWSSGVLRWDGAGWQPFELAHNDQLQGVWCGGPQGTWAVGSNGRVWRWGQGWSSAMTIGVDADLNAIAGRVVDGRAEVWAVGQDGTIARWDGTAWAVEASGGQALHGVWAAPPGGTFQAYAVGAEGTLMARGAQGWTAMESGTTRDLQAVTGETWDDAWIAGAGGTVLRYGGAGWYPLDLAGASDDLLDVQVVNPLEACVLGFRQVLCYASSSWMPEDLGSYGLQAFTYTSNHAWAVGLEGRILHQDR
ncbi:MAG TPA: hypothetical protein P5076_14910, partial [Myxococcota bacterium]|nr:hypothetical protein [Myxococcota bacterium]